MINSTIFHISRLRKGTCHHIKINFDTDVDPLIFLLNFHKFCQGDPDFTYFTFYDLYELLYIEDKEEFYKKLAYMPDIEPLPLGYDGRSTIAGFQSPMSFNTNSVVLTSDQFDPFIASCVNGTYRFESYLYENKVLGENEVMINDISIVKKYYQNS